jgi:hypothetical protein
LYMRGAFFVLFCLAATAAASAAGLGGEVSGFLSPDGFAQSFYLSFDHQLDSTDLRLGVVGEYGSEGAFQLSPRWQLELGDLGPFLLRAGRDVDHYTSSDLFRLISKNNRSPASSFLTLESPQASFGFLQAVPLRSGDPVSALFAEALLEAGPLGFRGLHLQFAGGGQGGTAAVLQAEAALGPWAAAAAAGWVQEGTLASRGTVVVLERSGSGLQGSFTWQSIEPGFASLLAKSNRYPPGRRGWELELKLPLGALEGEVDLRRQGNLAGTRSYNRLAFTCRAGENFSVQWRLEPTRALVLRYSGEGLLWQVDAVNLVVRHDRETEAGSWSWRADAKRRIARLEVQLDRTLKWRLVAKYDFLLHRAHTYLRVRWERAKQYVQLELGEYDGGNLTASFGQPAQLKLSWGWQF